MPFPAPEIRGRVDSTGRARLYIAQWEPRTLARDQGTPMQRPWLTQGQRPAAAWEVAFDAPKAYPRRARAPPAGPRVGAAGVTEYAVTPVLSDAELWGLLGRPPQCSTRTGRLSGSTCGAGLAQAMLAFSVSEMVAAMGLAP
jgi:hypothetical protein